MVFVLVGSKRTKLTRPAPPPEGIEVVGPIIDQFAACTPNDAVPCVMTLLFPELVDVE